VKRRPSVEAKVERLARIGKSLGLKSLAVSSAGAIHLTFHQPTEQVRPVKTEVVDPRAQLKSQIAEQLGGADPKDIEIPNEWMDNLIGGAREVQEKRRRRE
jgi:hypothetical protein